VAVELLARALREQASAVIAVELPATRAMMHLDTVMTMVDRATFVLYRYLDRHLRSWTLSRPPGAETVTVSRNQRDPA
jgi:arginine deiminase